MNTGATAVFLDFCEPEFLSWKKTDNIGTKEFIGFNPLPEEGR